MNSYVWFSLIGSVFGLIFGTYIYYTNPKRLNNIIFALFSYSLAIWSFTEFQMRGTTDYASSLYWNTLNVVWPIVIAFLIHFVIIYVDLKRLSLRYLFLILVYVSALIMLVVDYYVQPIYLEMKTWGWVGVYPQVYQELEIITKAWGAGLGIFAILVVAVYYFNTKNLLKKKQTLFVLVGISIMISGTVFTEVVLPEVFNLQTPGWGGLSFIIGTIPIGFGIQWFRLFTLSPNSVAIDIITTMSDGFVLIDNNKKIKSTNQSIESLLHYRNEELLNKNVEILFSYDVINIEKILRKGRIKEKLIKIKRRDGKLLPVSLSVANVSKKHGYNLGKVLIVRDMQESLNYRLQLEKQAKELQQKNKELEKMNKLMVGRELNMVELKKQLKSAEQ